MISRAVKFGVIPYGAVFRERRRGLIILGYHRIGGGTESQIDLPIDLFDRQMRYLRDHHTVVSLDAALDWDAAGRESAGSDVVAVTFDDGFLETYHNAFPILRRYGIPATVYLATQYIETQRPFDFGGYETSRSQAWPLRWEHVREMQASGLVAVGAHTHSHVDLTGVSLGTARDEIERSYHAVAVAIGSAPRHFAYPWGVLTPPVKDVVGQYFATAVRGGCGKNPFGTIDRLALWRQPIQQTDGFWFFRLKIGSYLDAEEYFRRIGTGGAKHARAFLSDG